jgi:hypothetical protein
MPKKDKRTCSVSHLGGNRYLLKGTPDPEVIQKLVTEQDSPYIIINIEGGNVRDLPGGIIPFPTCDGYLVFKRLFEANKRPAIYLPPDIARELITAPKDSVVVNSERVAIADMEFSLTGTEPLGYISLQTGKRILYRIGSVPKQDAGESAAQPATAEPVVAPESASAPTPTGAAAHTPEPEKHTVNPTDKANKILSIINAIADDERNLTLIKDIAYTAYSIIMTAKRNGAASKEQVATCVVAALSAPETRNALRRIGSDVFRRFKELNKEAGTVVKVGDGYRITHENEIILDEWPDMDMLIAIQAGMKTEIVKAHINFDRSLGFPEDLIPGDSTDYGYIIKTSYQLPRQNAGNQAVHTFFEKYKNTSVVYAGEVDGEFTVMIMDAQKVYGVGSLRSAKVFGFYESSHAQPLLYIKQDGQPVAEPMPVCPEIYTVVNQYAGFVADALPDKVLRVAEPHKNDTIALVKKGYKIGTEKKGDNWVLWGFPAGKTLNVNGLPKSIVGGVPQY